ncbi:MAG: ABC transporter substrate-binding protein [Thermomicrobiales bacterium]
MTTHGRNRTNVNPAGARIAATLTRRGLVQAAGAAAVFAATPSALASPHALPALQDVDRAATLIAGTSSSPSDLDPHSAYDGRSVMVIYGVYEQLMRLKGSSTDAYEPLLAESWEANDDQSVWTFHLREGATFHDGSPCDAEAVRLSFERLLTLGLGPFEVVHRFVSDPAQITAPDTGTVVFDLGQPQPLFEAALAAAYGPYIVNARLAREHEEDGDWGHAWAQTNADGMGTGPYQVTTYERESLVQLDRYEAYWGGWDGDHFSRIVIRVVPENETLRQLVEQGEIDIVDNLTPEATDALAENPGLRVERAYTTSDGYLSMTPIGPLETPAARQAMAWAFPYEEVVTGVYQGYAKAARGPLAELIRGFDPELPVYTTDLEKARQLLAEAGVTQGETLSMMLSGGSEAAKTMAQLFAANLEQLGLSLDIQAVDETTFIGTIFGEAPIEERPHFFPLFWQPDYNDGWNHLYAQVDCDAAFGKGANAGVYCNERVDELLDTARDAADEATYLDALAELQQILAWDDPAGVYYIQTQWTTILSAAIDGFATNPIATGLYDFYRMSRQD